VFANASRNSITATAAPVIVQSCVSSTSIRCAGKNASKAGHPLLTRDQRDAPVNAKILLSFVLAVVLLATVQYLFLPDWYRDARVDTSGWLIMLSIAVSIALSVLLIAYAIRKLLSGQFIDLGVSARRGSKIGSYLGGFGAYPFALFLGFVIGGNLGGGMAGIVSNAVGLGRVGIIFGIGLGMFVVTAFICSLTAFLGFILGGLVEKLFTKKI